MALVAEPVRLARAIRDRVEPLVGPLEKLGIPSLALREDELVSKLRQLPLRDLAEIGEDLGGAPETPLPLERLARAILDLPASEPKLSAVERAVITHALAVTNGNKSAAARLLGMDRKAFDRKARRALRRVR